MKNKVIIRDSDSPVVVASAALASDSELSSASTALLFQLASKLSKLSSRPSDSGNLARQLLEQSRVLSMVSFPRESGSVLIPLFPMSRLCKRDKFPSDAGSAVVG